MMMTSAAPALAQEAPPAPPSHGGGVACDDVGYEGTCVASVAMWAEDGSCHLRDCAGEGKTCGYVADGIGWGCLEGTERSRAIGPATGARAAPSGPTWPMAHAPAGTTHPYPVHVYPPTRTEWNSPGMAATGTLLTVIGGSSLVLGGLGLTVVPMDGGSKPTANLLSLGLLGGGAVFCGIGIPLIVVGAREVPVEDAPFVPQPQLRVGAGSVDFSMPL
jgi:hypothetical protein